MYECPELFAYNILSVAYALENILQFSHFFRHLGSIVGHLFYFLHFVELWLFGVSGSYVRSFFAPCVFACQHGVAGRGLVAAVAWAFVKRIPDSASRLTLGVSTFLAP